MASCSDAQANLASTAPSSALHVNYTLGMVLGVDDLTQEFAYLANRDQWAVRELHGYGTISGLAVRLEDTPDGPRVHVEAGSAAAPSGRLICVPRAQCAELNRWLAEPDNAARIGGLLEPGSPLGEGGSLTLYLTLCYADCTTLPVPIPGDPCRSEDQLMADSRVADDYLLELRTAPPAQREHDALRAYSRWLAQVPVEDDSPLSPLAPDTGQQWAALLRAELAGWGDDASSESPPASPLQSADLDLGPPPAELTIGHGQQAAFLAVAQRIWLTELRPRFMARTCENGHRPEHDCLLLARLAVPVLRVGSEGGASWQVDGLVADIELDESDRPLLAAPLPLAAASADAPPLPGTLGALTEPPAADLPAAPMPIIGNAGGIVVTERGGAIELSLPQPIAPDSTPRFAAVRTDRLETADLRAAGGQFLALREVDADMTPGPADYCLIATGDAAMTITLPRCTDANRGQVYLLKNARGSNASVAVAPAPGNRLDDGAPGAELRLPRQQAMRVIGDGRDTWHRI